MLNRVMNLGDLLTSVARRLPDEPGLITNERHFAWRDINTRVDSVANKLHQLGVRKGDRILVHSRNNAALFESAWAAFKLGAIWVPTNYRIAPPEAAFLAESSHASVMIYDHGFEQYADAVWEASPALRHVIAIGPPRNGEYAYEALATQGQVAGFDAVDVDRDDPLWFFYTSGTTGRPKAGVLTHGQMAFVVNNHLADLMPGLTQASRSLVVAPLSHGAGIHALVNVARGACSILTGSEKLDPEETWQLVEKYQVDNMFTVPTILKVLTENDAVDRYDHTSLRHVIYAGAPMYRVDQKHALAKLGRVLVQYYGLGEVPGNITVLPAALHELDDNFPGSRVGTCGYPRTGMEIGILAEDGARLAPSETGEICVRGPAVFAGYDNNPEATRNAFKDGWFHTGDLGHVDDEGFLYITGRASDMYISGGSNVYPREVEEAILTHDAVNEAAVFGVPDAKWGERGVAVVVCRRPASVSVSGLIAHLASRIAKYKLPKIVVFLDALPKTAYGKVSKKDLKCLLEQHWSELEPSDDGDRLCLDLCPTTVVHPGPAEQPRIVLAISDERSNELRVDVPPDANVGESIRIAAATSDFKSGFGRVTGGSFKRVQYHVMKPAVMGTQPYIYGSPILCEGELTLVAASITVGSKDDELVLHCHGGFIGAGGEQHGGHIVLDKSFAGREGLVLHLSLSTELTFIASPDNETGFDLLSPVRNV